MVNKVYTEQEIESKRKLSLVLYVIMFVLIIFIMIAMFAMNLKIGYVTILALGITGCFAGATILKLHIQPHLSELLMNKISLTSNIEKMEYYQKVGIPEKYFKQANFINKYEKYHSFDFVSSNIQDKDFLFSGISVKDKSKTTNTGELKTIFTGTFGITDFVTETPVDMIIAPDLNNKILNVLSEDFKKAVGANRKIVRLENQEFERLFEVYCEDQIMARKIITLTFMEKMVEFRNLINKNMTLIYKNNKIYFFIENKLILNTTRMYLEGVTDGVVEEATQFLNLISEIVNRSCYIECTEIDLGTSIKSSSCIVNFKK